MKYFGFLLCVAAALLLFFPITGATNDGPVQVMGGSASPKGPHEFIRMDSEEVKIKLLENSYEVDAVFHFLNTGETTTEWVGFPKYAIPTHDFIKFETWIDDQAVQFTEKSATQSGLRSFLDRIFSDGVFDNRWMVKSVTFPGHKFTTTRVKYEAEYQPVAGDDCVYYDYGTGSLWKGNIGKAVFAIDTNGTVDPESVSLTCDPVLKASLKLVSSNKMVLDASDFRPPSNARLSICFGRSLVKSKIKQSNPSE